MLFVAVAAAQLTTYLVVSRMNRHNAEQEVAADLAQAARVFDRVSSARAELLATSARAVASDYAIRSLFADAEDVPTLRSAFTSVRERIAADFVALTDLDGEPIATSAPVATPTLAVLVARADASLTAEATGYGFAGDRLHALVVVPVRAPTITAWLVVGYAIDRAFATDLQQQTAVDVSFVDPADRVAATSLPPARVLGLGEALAGLTTSTESIVTADFAGEVSLLTVRRKPMSPAGTMTIVLQYSLDEKLAPARRLNRLLLAVAAGGLVLAALLGLTMARRLSQPVQALAAHTRSIARGDYETRLTLDRADELGDLARSFNAMSTGLAERDRVRDLLDKNVSPAVATRLLRDGAVLGGEVRAVTILFADLRGFTPMSEHLAPTEVVALLNRYLDRMSAVIEAQGGIIDKFIGDEIMALFGAPVESGGDANRALRAALGMRAALAEFNAELAAENKPPLAFGIGINTGPVVAGNIGSHRRLNFSVIGDAVNLAARLQTLTRQRAFAADIIVSRATLLAAGRDYTVRDLGPVAVKGRSQTVEAFALDGES